MNIGFLSSTQMGMALVPPIPVMDPNCMTALSFGVADMDPVRIF